MGKIFILIGFILILFSCKKGKEDEPKVEPATCQNLDMTGELSRLTGKWKWLYTDMAHIVSFDCSSNGASYIYPTDVNFTFKLEITNNGKLKVIKNDTLTDVLYFTGINYSLIIQQFNVFEGGLYYNCLNDIVFFQNSTSHDTLIISLPQLSFNNGNQTQVTGTHYFVRN